MTEIKNAYKGQRDTGLDIIRALALVLMTSIHYARPISSVTRLVDYLKFIGEAAPAFFFFAFGMTMVRFLIKDPNDQSKRLTAFLYISLIHNIFVKQTFVTGFLFILWVIQFFFYLTNKYLKRPDRIYFFILLTSTAALCILPHHKVSTFFSMIIPGYFPILPWGLFVMAGYFFAKYRPSKRSHTFYGAVVLIGAATAGSWLYHHFGWNNFKIQKWPLTVSYLLLFCGANIFLVTLSGIYQKSIIRFSPLYKPAIFISRNLLLATVLSYIPCTPLMYLNLNLFPENYILDHAVLFLLGGSIASILLLLAIIKLALMGWEQFKKLPLYPILMQRFDTVALISIPICAICMGIVRYVLDGPGYYLLGIHNPLRGDGIMTAYNIMIVVSMVLMVLYTFLMIERRQSGTIRVSRPNKLNLWILILMLFVVSTHFFPKIFEPYYLMRSQHKDYVPARLKKEVTSYYARKGIQISYLRPEEKISFDSINSIYPFRCIIKKKNTEYSAVDSVLFFAFKFDPPTDASKFYGVESVSYESYARDLYIKGMPYLKQELLKLFPNLLGT